MEYLPNDYNDDHFDLDGHRDHLVGKALAKLAEACPTGDEGLNLSLKMLGWALFDKVGETFESSKV